MAAFSISNLFASHFQPRLYSIEKAITLPFYVGGECIASMIARIIRVVFFVDLWSPRNKKTGFQDRLICWLKNIGKIALAPFVVIAAECIIIYSLFDLNRAKKYINTLQAFSKKQELFAYRGDSIRATF